MRGVSGAVAQEPGKAAVDVFGCVQDGEEPKGEVMTTETVEVSRWELSRLVQERIKALLAQEELSDVQIERVARLSAVVQTLESGAQ